jgi:hypothetical protein
MKLAASIPREANLYVRCFAAKRIKRLSISTVRVEQTDRLLCRWYLCAFRLWAIGCFAIVLLGEIHPIAMLALPSLA